MKIISYKAHIVLFGKYDFPTNGQTSIGLMTNFAALNLLPSVVQTTDALGSQQQRICLGSSDSRFRIVFGGERIELIFTDLAKFSFESLLERVRTVAQVLHDAYGHKFGRVAYITETLWEGVEEEEFERFQKTLMPFSGDGAIEWHYRWVNRLNDLVFCHDLARAFVQKLDGLGLEEVVALKESYDISSTNLDLTLRFSPPEVMDLLMSMNLALQKHENETKEHLR